MHHSKYTSPDAREVGPKSSLVFLPDHMRSNQIISNDLETTQSLIPRDPDEQNKKLKVIPLPIQTSIAPKSSKSDLLRYRRARLRKAQSQTLRSLYERTPRTLIKNTKEKTPLEQLHFLHDKSHEKLALSTYTSRSRVQILVDTFILQSSK